MKELIQQQHILKRHILICGLASYIHSWIMSMVAGGLMGWFFDEVIYFLVGFVILLSGITVSSIFVTPRFEKYIDKLKEEQNQLGNSFKRLEAINQSLDDRREKMLFDHDYYYWELLEKLAE